MRPRVGRTVEVDTIVQFDALLSAGAQRMSGWRLQTLDLTTRDDELRGLDPAGALFLGVDLADGTESWLREHGALVFPTIPELPFDPYRASLYTPDELYRGLDAGRYHSTPDAQIYAWSRQRHGPPERALSRTLHDLAIDGQLDVALAGRRVVGVMGGHAVQRTDADYQEAARLGRALTRYGLLVATGGGPGAMEAANLGAYLASEPDHALDEAISMLGRVPGFRPSVTRWADVAFDVRKRWPGGAASIGIPTWFYGHEPPNAFASGIAKYFRNAIREDTLLGRCDAGIVFLPGAAGTVQEIFQDGCENYYADDATVAPMVLLGTNHWTREVPAWPLLSALATGRPMAQHVHLADSADDAVAVLTGRRSGQP